MQRFGQVFLIFLLGTALTSVWLKSLLTPTVWHTFVFEDPDQKYKVKEVAVVGDFSQWQPWYYLKKESPTRWKITLPLKPGWHYYRFFLNNHVWMKDPKVKDYGGPFSNSKIFVDSQPLPRVLSVWPATGSWLFSQPDSMVVRFDQPLQTILQRFKIEVQLDSIPIPFKIKESRIWLKLPKLSEGEHVWQLQLKTKTKSEPVLQKEGFYFVNCQNQPPVAHAGFTQIVFLNQTVRLNGGLSFDPDFEPLVKFQWQQVAGKKVKLNSANRPFATFQARYPGYYRFRLTVKDSMGLTASAKVDVVVLPNEQKKTRFVFKPIDSLKVRKVALVGEFNNWNPKKHVMVKDEKQHIWWIELPLPPGVWEYKWVVNDSLWLTDATNPQKVADGWNGFNALKTVPAQPYFDGTFKAGGKPAPNNVLEIQFHPDSLAANMRFHWFKDINNPLQVLKTRQNKLYFDRRWPKGNYYYYLVLEKDGEWSAPQVLLINHFNTTEWMDLRQTPAWADTSLFYALFVRKFSKQGNLKGVIRQLPYLKQLGVNALWLLPVYEGPTEHGYAPTSLFSIEKDYGTLNDFRNLIQEAHRLGLKVIFDFVANHLSDQHRFVRAASENPLSPLRNWFYWKADGTWGYHNDWDTLVNLNFNTPWVRHYILNAALFWLNLGVDGFRCDVAWAIPHDFWKQFRRVVKQVNPQCLLLNEVLPRQRAFHELEFDMSYDTDFYGNLLDVLNGKKPLSALPFGLSKGQTNYPRYAQALRYLENHDLPRLNTLFPASTVKAVTQLWLTLPGTPLIYYGQEYFLSETRPQFSKSKNEKWFDFFQKHIKLRIESKALKKGKMQNLVLDDPSGIWIFKRFAKDDSVRVFVNFTKKQKKIKILNEATK